MSAKVPGCHGIAVSPTNLGLELGWIRKAPALEVHVELAETVRRADPAELVWQFDEPPRFGLPAVRTQTWVESDGSVWVGNTLNLSVRVDHRRRSIVVAARDRNLQVILEALASIALPIVAQDSGKLVLHGSAASTAGSATLLCADGGSGKSSLLMGLVAAGWEAVSEDQCVVDLDAEGGHRIWPGPSWVRLKRGAWLPPLVSGRPSRFETVDKIAWDLEDHMARGPAKLGRVVLLEPPGGDEAILETLPEGQVIAALIQHATWIQGRDGFASAVLPALVKLAIGVPAYRMRLTRDSDWLESGVALLTRSW